MDRERLTELLGAPGSVSRGDLADLRDLAERFPWFSGARLLLAVGEDHAGDVLANDRSTSPAVHLPSRAVLFDLTRQSAPRALAPMQVVRNTADLDVVHVMRDPEKSGASGAKTKAAEIPRPEPLVVKTATKPVDSDPEIKAAEHVVSVPTSEGRMKTALPSNETPTAGAIQAEVPEKHSAPAPLAQETAPSEVSVPKEPPPLPGAVSETAVPVEDPSHQVAQGRTPVLPAIGPIQSSAEKKEADPLAQLYREAAANAPFQVAEVLTEQLAPMLIETEVALPEQDTLPKPAEEPLLGPAPERVQLDPNAKLSFTDWLMQATDASFIGTMEVAVHEEPIAASDEYRTVADILHLTAADRPVEELPSPEEILERFIHRAEPAPIKAKTEFFSPQQAAKKSLQDDGLVSETLGRIYEKQGNYVKAKQVYEQLAKLDPRKSVYFAALSKALDGRMNP